MCWQAALIICVQLSGASHLLAMRGLQLVLARHIVALPTQDCALLDQFLMTSCLWPVAYDQLLMTSSNSLWPVQISYDQCCLHCLCWLCCVCCLCCQAKKEFDLMRGSNPIWWQLYNHLEKAVRCLLSVEETRKIQCWFSQRETKWIEFSPVQNVILVSSIMVKRCLFLEKVLGSIPSRFHLP